MIITCNNCNKKFDVTSNLIPDSGRLLQCAGCNHKWFFKKEITEKVINPIGDVNDDISIFDQNNSKDNTKIFPPDQPGKIFDTDSDKEIYKKTEFNKDIEPDEKNSIDANNDKFLKTNQKKQKNFKILNIILVAIISFVAFIIIIDTFKYPIGKIVPNIELILYNLYESIKDISLFIKDLT